MMLSAAFVSWLTFGRIVDQKNNKLSASRADYIATELCKRGVAVENITKVSQGGISNYVPTEANRHTKVMLYMK